MKTQDAISIFIDNNVWDLFFKFNVDLSSFFPKHFKFCIPAAVKYESEQIPKTKDKEGLRNYIFSQQKHVFENRYFQFGINEEHPRGGGFGHGAFMSTREREALVYFRKKYPLGKKRKESQVTYPNEGDLALAIRTISYPVLTFDKKSPFTDEKCKFVIFLPQELYEKTEEEMRSYIIQEIEAKIA